MNNYIGRATIGRLLLAGLMSLAAASSAHAASNWEVGKQLHTDHNCAGCHARKDGATISDITTAITNQAPMNALFAAGKPEELSADNISDISAYLNHLNFPIAALDQSSFAFSPISVDLSTPRTFHVSNSGDANLVVTGASISGGNGYLVDATACTAGAVAPGGQCNVIVTFQPPTATTFNNRTLTVNFSNTFSGQATAFPINGTGLAQFTVSTTLLEFTSVTAPSGVLQLTIVDNKGDRIRICRGDASTFNFPNDFSLDAPFTLGGDGCFTSTTTTTHPRTMNVPVHFVAGGIGPRNGVLTVRRVDGAGTTLGSTTTVQLHGNPGPLVTVDASTLFDQPADPPGVEIDNDNTLDRTVNVFSQGSDPLVFDGSTFTISGTSASEYSLLATGCRAIAGLASGATSPTPSCALTVRFNPAGLDLRPASLLIQVAGAPTRTIQLNGRGFFGPRLVVSQASGTLSSGATLNFGAQTIGGLYPSRVLTLHNGGTLGNLEVVVPPSSSTPGFTVTPDAACATPLAPGAQCSVALHFDPTQAQTYAANFVLQSRPAGTAAYTNFNLALNGQGTASALPSLVWADATGTTTLTTWSFGIVDVGTPATATVRLRNDGPGGAVVSLVNAVGATASNFIVDGSACTTLFEAGSCVVTIQFAPGSAGAKTAMLQAVSAAGSPTVNVLAPDFVLTGTGRGAPATGALVASTSSLSFSGVAGSPSLPLDVTVTNTSGNAVQVLGYDISAGYTVDKKTCPATPFTLTAGSQCTLSVTFHPQGAGATQGALHVQIEGQTSTLDVTLSGNATPQADVSSGGCTVAGNDPRVDPMLWVLVLLAAAALWVRRKERYARHAETSAHRRNEPNP